MPGSISFRKIPVFLAGAWESLVVDSERSVLWKKAACLSSPQIPAPQFGTGAAGLCCKHVLGGESGKAGHSPAIGNALINLGSLGASPAKLNSSPWE